MTTNAVKFQTTVVKCTDGTDSTTVGEVIGVDGPNGQATIIDATHSASTAREKVMGLPDEGRITLSCNYVPSDGGQTELRTRRNDQSLDTYEIELAPATTSLTFSAYCLGFSISGATDGKWDARIDLEISGSVTVS